MSRRKILVFTSSRADLGPLGPVISALDASEAVQLTVVAAGTHVADWQGNTLDELPIDPRSVTILTTAGSERALPSVGEIVSGLDAVLDEEQPEMVVILGDRWELLAAAMSCLARGIRIAHLHGGEVTEGAIDDRVRHALTKLSDLHLCATETAAARLAQLGEEPWRIHVTGAPGLDRLRDVRPLEDAELARMLGVEIRRPLALVTYHAPTVDRSSLRERARAVLDGVATVARSAIATFAGPDPGADVVIDEIEAAGSRHDNLHVVPNLGRRYPSMLATCDVIVGNSSSGIIESATFQLPAVDVGDRQAGRLRPANVLHCGERFEAVVAAVQRAVNPDFRRSIRGVKNPYGDGMASQRILDALVTFPRDAEMRKRFVSARQ